MKMDFDRTNVYNDNGWEYGGLVKKWGIPLEGLPQTSKRIWGLDYQMDP
jgi:hypothetical protein